jgi:hypothetical protein
MQLEADKDPFMESDEQIAAQVRQLFRARREDDRKAVEVEMFYLEGYLCLTLRRHLRDSAYSWGSKSPRWIDGLSAIKVEYPSPGRLRIQAEAAWVVGQELWYDDPWEFELQLCPRTGAFVGYVFRFGDHYPLEKKKMGRTVSIPPKGGWEHEFRRGRIESVPLLAQELKQDEGGLIESGRSYPIHSPDRAFTAGVKLTQALEEDKDQP